MRKTTSCYERQHLSQLYMFTGSGHSPLCWFMALGKTANMGMTRFAFLKERFSLIIPDLPGSGESAMIEDMSIDGMAEVIHSIYHVEGNSNTCPVIGHSMGGYIDPGLAKNTVTIGCPLRPFSFHAYADRRKKRNHRRKGMPLYRNTGF